MYFSCLSSKSAADGAKVASMVPANTFWKKKDKDNTAQMSSLIFPSEFVTAEIHNYLSSLKNVTR